MKYEGEANAIDPYANMWSDYVVYICLLVQWHWTWKPSRNDTLNVLFRYVCDFFFYFRVSQWSSLCGSFSRNRRCCQARTSSEQSLTPHIARYANIICIFGILSWQQLAFICVYAQNVFCTCDDHHWFGILPNIPRVEDLVVWIWLGT